MSVELIGLISILVLLFFIFSGMWLGFSMAFVGFTGLVLIMGFEKAISVLGTLPYTTVAFYPISTLPLFVLMGVVIGASGIGNDLYYTAYKWFGRLPGGLAISTVFAAGGMAAITGSSSASIVTLGSVALPEMKKYKYSESLAAGTIAAGGTIGILIPPSLGFILYAVLTEESIGQLFMAGMIPGILEVLFYVMTIFLICLFKPSYGPRGSKSTWVEKVQSLKSTWAVFTLFFIVIGGIYGGIITPTEAGAIGAFGAIVIVFAMGRMSVPGLLDSVMKSLELTGMIFMLVIGSFLFAHFLALTKLPFFLSGLITELSISKYVALGAVILLYVILGMFLDIFSCIILTVPILYPTIQELDFNMIWFGVIMVRVMEIGLITPPIGMNAFMLAGVSKLPLDVIFRGIIPFFFADIAHVIILIVFPKISLWLPQTMF
jgi:tripartite ATP-independent transporter DctM subunit